MKPLPFPIRVAAGLALSTAERVRALPRQLIGLPVTAASQVLQLSMRVQQQVTELAIKGDDVLSGLRPVEDTPSWATFDEDAEIDLPPARPRSATVAPFTPEPEPEPTPESARTVHNGQGTPPAEWTEAAPSPAPAGLVDYDELTLPQVRARLRQFSLAELEELLAYERAHADRSSFTGMLSRRIANVHKADPDDTDDSPTADPTEADPTPPATDATEPPGPDGR